MRRQTSNLQEKRKAGLDVGAMAVFGRVRIGVMVRNVNELEFGSGSDAFTLDAVRRAPARR